MFKIILDQERTGSFHPIGRCLVSNPLDSDAEFTRFDMRPLANNEGFAFGMSHVGFSLSPLTDVSILFQLLTGSSFSLLTVYCQ